MASSLAGDCKLTNAGWGWGGDDPLYTESITGADTPKLQPQVVTASFNHFYHIVSCAVACRLGSGGGLGLGLVTTPFANRHTLEKLHALSINLPSS